MEERIETIRGLEEAFFWWKGVDGYLLTE